MKKQGIRRVLALVLPLPVAVVLPGCFTTEDDPYAWEENTFLRGRPPTYGYGAPPTGRPYGSGGAVAPGDYRSTRGGTMYLPTAPPPRQGAPGGAVAPGGTQASGGGNQGGSQGGWVPFWQRRSGEGAVSSGSSGSGRTGRGEGEVASTTPVPSNPGANPAGGAGTTTPPPAVPKPEESGHPYGVKIPGKPGYVYSPHDPERRVVDVIDVPPGTEVRCPYTRKIFRVP